MRLAAFIVGSVPSVGDAEANVGRQVEAHTFGGLNHAVNPFGIGAKVDAVTGRFGFAFGWHGKSLSHEIQTLARDYRTSYPQYTAHNTYLARQHLTTSDNVRTLNTEPWAGWFLPRDSEGRPLNQPSRPALSRGSGIRPGV